MTTTAGMPVKEAAKHLGTTQTALRIFLIQHKFARINPHTGGLMTHPEAKLQQHVTTRTTSYWKGHIRCHHEQLLITASGLEQLRSLIDQQKNSAP